MWKWLFGKSDSELERDRQQISEIVKLNSKYCDAVEACPPTVNSKVGDVIKFGNYPTSNLWIVVEKKGNKLLLLSKYIVMEKQFSNCKEDVSCPWARSDLRRWLNNNFYQEAFSEEEKKKICLVHLENKNSRYVPNEDDYGGATEDKVFLLSKNEASALLSSLSSNAKGLMPYGREDNWWLRSPGNPQYTRGIVTSEGWISSFAEPYLTEGVRPSIEIEL